MNEIDKYLIRLNPDKKQFKFFRDWVIPTEIHLKQSLKKGIEHLLASRNLIMKCFQKILLMRELFLKSKIFTDEQLIRANIKGKINKHAFKATLTGG